MPSEYALPVTGHGRVISIGPVQAAPLARVIQEEDEKRQAEADQTRTELTQLAAYIRSRWSQARDAKRNTVETRMLRSMRARRGEYDPEVISAIREMGGTGVYAMLTSVKCRAAGSWLRDVLMAGGTEKPWSLKATPNPDLPKNIEDKIVAQVAIPIAKAEMDGQPLSDAEVNKLFGIYKDQTMNWFRAQARTMAARMESKMEDQLVEGGFKHALNQFIDDIVTYPAAILKGPVVRQRNHMEWGTDAQGRPKVKVKRQIRLEWERVSPFDIYPSADAEGVNDGYLIEKHRLSRGDLHAMLGVAGYKDDAIKLVLEQHSKGLREFLYDDTGQVEAEGKSLTNTMTNPDELIDALQFWGSVQGSMLRDWGMSEEEVPDTLAEYDIEAWLIGNTIIKAVRNSHPLGHKPYYKTSYEEIPGSFWGNSPADLVRDAQTVVNTATRALVNNMSLASGPQVVVNVERLADGEQIQQLRPWRIWQVTSDAVGNSSAADPAITFKQPDSRIPELAGIIEKFSTLADEWSGVPRYLTGDAPGGAGRTASGLSMLMNNAGKSLKQVVSNVDNYVLRPMLERLHMWNMLYNDDPDLKGDINIVVRGANALVAREAAELRRNEFLQMTANPIDSQILGPEGRAEILREVAKGLDMNVDEIIPPKELVKQQVEEAKREEEKLARRQAQNEAHAKEQAKIGGGQTLEDGTPVTDNFGPPKVG